MWSRLVPCFVLLISIKISHSSKNDVFMIISSTTPSSQNCAQNSKIEELTTTIAAFNRKLDLRLESLENQIKKTENHLKDIKSKNSGAGVPGNCREVLERGNTASGVYKIKPRFGTEEISVLCDMKRRGGGWTYFLNRYEGSQDFYLDYKSYTKGFGTINGEFWLGLENLHLLTGFEINELLLELVDWEDKQVSGHYDIFTVGGEKEGYRLKYLQGYNGDDGDMLTHQLGMKFTTKDKDQDVWENENCATFSKGGWWYRDCKRGHPTGLYLGQSFDRKDSLTGIFWDTFHGNTYSLKEVRLMVRPSRPVKNVNPAF